MSIIMGLLNLILAIIFIIAIIVIGVMIAEKVYGQETATDTSAPPAPIAPTPTVAPTPTASNPNFQYLPQKAYVQPFAPEVGIPSNGIPLTAVPQVVPVSANQQQGIGGLDLTSIIAAITGIAGVGYAHISKKKADAATDLTKTTMGATLTSKEQIEQLAKTLFNSMPQKGNEITDQPAIQLENLSKDKQEFADTAAKA